MEKSVKSDARSCNQKLRSFAATQSNLLPSLKVMYFIKWSFFFYINYIFGALVCLTGQLKERQEVIGNGIRKGARSELKLVFQQAFPLERLGLVN